MVIYVIFPPAPTDIVILGVDARPGQGYLTRTDSVMILNVSPVNDVSLLSIPRDVFIQVPDYGEQRINTINMLGEQEEVGGGLRLIKASLDESFSIEIENYIRLDFNGFVAVVDAVGGVDIDVPKLIIDYDYPTIEGGIITVQFDPGTEHMDGERALQYARTRHQDSDYDRAARQQQVVDAVVAKLVSPQGVIYIPKVWQAINAYTQTDLNLWDMMQMGPALVLGWSGHTHRVLMQDDLIGMRAGYWIPAYESLQPWIDDHFD
ncbi:MAG: LCP family protein [Anaerolineae bacterium]|nr:LCP family protein [Anaerolineae bacterium]